MARKVLLCGEGPTDYGNIKFGSSEWEKGPVQEIIGNKNDPNSDHPKNYLQRVLDQYHAQGNRETFKNIAENINICELKQKCPISFKRFHADMRVIL